VLDELADRLDARGRRELLELRELLLLVDAGREHAEDEPALGLRARRGIRLAMAHGKDYAACSDSV
jgi:hypothetical protein